MNQLAARIARREGKKIPLTIAQVKEVLRCLADEINHSPEADMCWNKYCWQGFQAAVRKGLGEKKR